MPARIITLAVVIALIIGAIVYLERVKVSAPVGEGGDSTIIVNTNETRLAKKARDYPTAREISSPDGFINTDRITIQELIGKKIILVDFWTYSCINCQRTTPYLNAWYEKYRDKGLEIIGIHTPEFDFEKKYENVERAVDNFGIKYPVVLDNDYSTWYAYENRYWPHKYLIDIDGFIVYDHVGEGGYDETERRIQAALEERSAVLAENIVMDKNIARPVDATPSPTEKTTPEIYFGSLRNEYLGTLLTLEGDWDIRDEYAENKTANAKIILKYRAREVNLVAGGPGVRLELLLDGKPLSKEAGRDAGTTLTDERLYNLIADPAGYSEHTLEIRVLDPGLRAFTFTFG